MNYVTSDGELNKIKIIKHVVIGIIFLTLFFGSFGTVGAGERGVKTRLGKIVGVVEPGLYFKLPFIEKIHKMSVKTQTVTYEKENPLTSASKDLQDVSIATVVNYHIDPTKVEEIFVKFGTVEAFEENAIRPVVRDTVKAVSSQFTAEELVTKRAQFGNDALKLLNERLQEKSVFVEEGNITNLQFSPSFSQAIEAKVTAVQNAEAAKNKLEQIKFEAEQKVVTAKAEAESIRLQSDAANNEKFIQLKALEVQQDAIKKWNGVLPTQMIPGGSVPFVNLTK